MLYPIELRAQEPRSYRTESNPGKPVIEPGLGQERTSPRQRCWRGLGGGEGGI